jgi:hypothetical protein
MSQSAFEVLEAAAAAGAPAVLDRLIETLRSERKLPQLFEALLMKKRHELGLPLTGSESLRDLPEELQATVEDFYIETCRTVGGLFLEEGDIAGAWPYFRAIDEPEAVAKALDAWVPPSETSPESRPVNDCDAIIDIALHQGANPRRGYELILSQYGSCRAITVFEHQFPYRGEVREECGVRLVRQLYRELLEGIKSDVLRREGQVPQDASVRSLIAERPWLFENHGYHVDMSHLQAVVRAAPSLRSEPELRLVIEMCDYGRQLAKDFQVTERPPFEDFYGDHRILLRALVGEGVDGAVRYFKGKAERAGPDDEGGHLPGEVLVHLLSRAGRHHEAIEAYLEYLRNAPGPLRTAPSLAELCERAGDFTSLLELSRERQDLLQYGAALVKRMGRESPPAASR